MYVHCSECLWKQGVLEGDSLARRASVAQAAYTLDALHRGFRYVRKALCPYDKALCQYPCGTHRGAGLCLHNIRYNVGERGYRLGNDIRVGGVYGVHKLLGAFGSIHTGICVHYAVGRVHRYGTARAARTQCARIIKIVLT